MVMTLTFDQSEPQDWRCVLDARAALGEVPVWDSEHQALYWVDVYRPALYRTDPVTGQTQTWPMPEEVGSFALHEDGRHAILALTGGLYDLDLVSQQLTLLHAAPYDRAQYRFNDAKCDPVGRFWVGTVRHPGSTAAEGTSAFWCLDRGVLRTGFGAITVANGVGFSPDGATMYVADRPGWQILAFDYDLAAGQVSRRRQFAQVQPGHIPDGAAVDQDGAYWIALFGVGMIACFETDGRLRRVLRAPTSHPTMVAFGGPAMRTLYVTTARDFLDRDGLAAEPLAGGVFSCELDSVGREDYRYRPA